jgi:hypothetical protein
VEASTSHNPMGLHGLLQGYLYTYHIFSVDVLLCYILYLSCTYASVLSVVCLHLRGRRIIQERNQHESGSKQNKFIHNHRCENLKSYIERKIAPVKKTVVVVILGFFLQILISNCESDCGAHAHC